jgi:hypothetical protein
LVRALLLADSSAMGVVPNRRVPCSEDIGTEAAAAAENDAWGALDAAAGGEVLGNGRASAEMTGVCFSAAPLMFV